MRITIKGWKNKGLPLQIIFTPRKEKEKRKEEKKGYTLQTARERRLSRFLGRILPEAKRGVEIVPKTRRAWPLLPVSGTAIFVYSFFFGGKRIMLSLFFYCNWFVIFYRGKLVAVNKIYHWFSVGKELWGKRNECSLRNGNEYIA